MLLYHFTDSASAELIIKEGINVGVVPFGDVPKRQYVSLTGNLNPNGHGLFSGEVILENHVMYPYWAKNFPERMIKNKNGNCFELTDKTEVVFEIEIDDLNTNLMNLDQFIFDTISVLKLPNVSEVKDTLKADCIVSGKFPLGESNSPNDEYKKMVDEEKTNPTDHLLKWYFYKEKIPSVFIKRVLYRQGSGNYQEK